MYVAWTKHIEDPQEKQDFESSIRGSRLVLGRLKAILEEKLEEEESSETSLKSYDSPNWDYKQAHKNGFRSCLKNLIKLVDLDQQSGA